MTKGINKFGFTLIELLVVISIIGILIGLSVFGLQGARQASRDASRKADLEQIRSGLEIYKADCNKYPTSASPALFTLPGSTSLTGTGSPASCPASNSYISKVPVDPIPAQNYSYVSADGTSYILCAALEHPPSPAGDTAGCGTCVSGGGACNLKVTSP